MELLIILIAAIATFGILFMQGRVSPPVGLAINAAAGVVLLFLTAALICAIVGVMGWPILLLFHLLA